MTPQSFRDAYRNVGAVWTGRISEWDMHPLVRVELRLAEDDVSDDSIAAAWAFMDPDNSGELDVEDVISRARVLHRAINEKPSPTRSPIHHLGAAKPNWGHTGGGSANKSLAIA